MTVGGGGHGASYYEPKIIQELNTLILIYSIKQTLRPKKICFRSLDPQKFRGCKFSTKKNMWDLPVRYTASNPPLPIIFIFWYMSNLFKEVEMSRQIKQALIILEIAASSRYPYLVKDIKALEKSRGEHHTSFLRPIYTV